MNGEEKPSEAALEAKLRTASKRYAKAKAELKAHVGSPIGPEYLAKVEAWRQAVGALARAAVRYSGEPVDAEEETA